MSFKDFENFDSENSAPAALRNKTKESILSELKPSWSQTLGKLSLIHLGTAVVTLSLCPQFGLRLVNHELWSLFDLFMVFGHTVCSILCGAFFIGSSIWASRHILSDDEWVKLKTNASLPIIYLTAFSLLGFLLSDADLDAHQLAFWIFGAALTGWALIRVVPGRLPERSLS